jgi:hypothetical protein
MMRALAIAGLLVTASPAALAAAPSPPAAVLHDLRYSVTNLDVRVEVNGVPVAHPRSEGGAAVAGQASLSEWLRPGKNEVRVFVASLPATKGDSTVYVPRFEIEVIAGQRGEHEGRTLVSARWDGKGPPPREKVLSFVPARAGEARFWKVAEPMKDDAATRAGALAAFAELARAYERQDVPVLARLLLFAQNEQELASGEAVSSLAAFQEEFAGMFRALPAGSRYRALPPERIGARLVAGGRLLILSGNGAPLLATERTKGEDGGESGLELDGLGYARVGGAFVLVGQGLE